MKALFLGAGATAFVAIALLGCETPGPGEPVEPGIHMEDPPEEPALPEEPMPEPPLEEPVEEPVDQDLPPLEEPVEEPVDQDLPPLEEPVEEPMGPDDMEAPDDLEDFDDDDLEDLDDDDFGDPLEGFEEF